jgi:YbdK family carboxylate-amine ligase
VVDIGYGHVGRARDGIACLDVLAAQMHARGWSAYITTPPGRLASLFVQDPHDPAECGDIVAARDATTGHWWYWFSWAERIAPAHTPAAAADAIIGAFQRPADDPPEPGPEPGRRPVSGRPPAAPRPAPRRLLPAGSRRASLEPRPRSPSRAFRPGGDAGAARHARKWRSKHVTLDHTGRPPARQHPDSVAVGVEEEFHTVGLRTRRLAAQAGHILAQLPAGSFSSELHQSVVEANSRPHIRLTDLAADIAALRRAAIDTAEQLELGLVAAGTVPIADPDTVRVTSDPRYEHIRGEYRMLVREQLICGLHIHVDLADRDLAVAVAHRMAPWLPPLLALSASSPFWLGTDTGYASYRTLIWRRWPTTGAPAGFASAADYDQTVADLVRSGVVTDPGMIYFDVRPSAHLPTVELRICDACPRLQDVVLLAGLFRALVIRETGAAVTGRAPLRVRPELLEAATWRAARSGLEGDLVDPATAAPVPARQLIRQLLADLRPALETTGDWDQVTGLTESALARVSSAARQRAAYARGGLEQVVDTLLEETRAGTGGQLGARPVGAAAQR